MVKDFKGGIFPHGKHDGCLNTFILNKNALTADRFAKRNHSSSDKNSFFGIVDIVGF